MGRLIAIANQKGGVGKTTTAVNLAVALGAGTRKILLVDLDPQGNASSGLAAEQALAAMRTSGRTVYEAVTGRLSLAEIIRPVRPLVALAPAGPDLVGAEIELATKTGRERRLKELLAPLRDQYGLILIDTPPSLGLLTLNALVAADTVIVPMQCEYYALEGLTALLETIRRVRATLNPALEIEGLVLTMFDARNRLCHEIAREVERHFPEKVFQNFIPRNVRLSESPSHGLAALEYDPRSAGAEAYRNLAGELIARLGRVNGASGEPPALEAGRRSWSLRALFSRERAGPARS